MSVQSISSVPSAGSQSPAAELQDLLKSTGKAKPASGGADSASGSSQDPSAVVSTTTIINDDGTITTTTTYADGSTSVTTTLDPNGPSKADKKGPKPVTASQPIDNSDPAQLSALLNAQESSGADQIVPRLKGDLADL